jgi:hypothetical protein
MNVMRCGFRWMQVLRGATRWGAVALAAFYLNFVAVHLAMEMHFHHGEIHDAKEEDHDHEHDGSGHTPHDASEHLLDVALKAADILDAPVLAIASETFTFDVPTLFAWTQRVFERERPPGEFFVSSQQSRAPPLA